MSHWYDHAGNPRYEVESKKGDMRPTHLGDAKKQGWVPSVSTVWSDIIKKPRIDRWVQTELMSALWGEFFSGENLNKSAGFPEYEQLARKKQAQSQHVVMNRGTLIHDSLEKYFKGEDTPREHMFLCDNVSHALDDKCGNGDPWIAEKSFSHPSGYGGKVDLYNEEWVVDFKSKDFSKPHHCDGNPPKPLAKKMIYDDMGVQLAAYDQGLGGGRRLLNVFIDINGDDHKCSILEWEWEDSTRLRDMFNHCLELWKLMKKYDPSFVDKRIL